MRERVRRFVAEYGAVGIGVYLVIHLATFFGAWTAIRGGWRPRGVGANASAVVMAYLFTSLTKVPRFAASAALTPLVARGWARVRGRPRAGAPEAAPAAALVAPVSPPREPA
jgi:hypothetical protein